MEKRHTRRCSLAAPLDHWCSLNGRFASAASPYDKRRRSLTRTCIYGRVEGSALLANLAFPRDLAAARDLSVQGGRWRAGNRTDAQNQGEAWARRVFAMSMISPRRGSRACPVGRSAMCNRWVHAMPPITASTRNGYIFGNRPADTWWRSRNVGDARTRKREDGIRSAATCGQSSAWPAVRSQHLSGQPVDAGCRQRRGRATTRLADDARQRDNETDADHSFRR